MSKFDDDELGDYGGYMSEEEEEYNDDAMSIMSAMSLQSQDDIMEKLKKHEITQEFKRKKQLSDQELMQECAKEWNETREVAWFLWNGAKERLRISTNDSQLSGEQKGKILEKIITGCNDLTELINKNEILNPWNDNDDPLQWIEQWKKSSSEGGKGVVVDRGKLFQGQQGLDYFKNFLTNPENIEKSINSQVRDVTVDEILPPTTNYIEYYEDLFVPENRIINKKILNVGEVIIAKPKNVMDDLNNAMNQLSVEEEYTVDDLINDVQNKLQFKINDDDKEKIKKSIDDKEKSIINVGNLIEEIEKIATKAAVDKAGKTPLLEKITKNDSLITIYGTKQPEEMQFIEPYKDPHFTFLGTDIEYWVPKVHFQTGLEVFNEKKEILRKTNKGTTVYLKYQSVKVKNDKGKTIDVYYIRKFLDFNDFLKSWQETYVRKYFEFGEKIIKLVNNRVNQNPWKNLNIYVIRRKYYRYKIKDIKLYFLEEMKKERKDMIEETKLCDYASDEVVTLLLSEDIPLVEQELWDYIKTVNVPLGEASKKALEKLKKTFKEYYPKLFPKEEKTEEEKEKEYQRQWKRRRISTTMEKGSKNFFSKKKMLNRRKRR